MDVIKIYLREARKEIVCIQIFINFIEDQLIELDERLELEKYNLFFEKKA